MERCRILNSLGEMVWKTIMLVFPDSSEMHCCIAHRRRSNVSVLRTSNCDIVVRTGKFECDSKTFILDARILCRDDVCMDEHIEDRGCHAQFGGPGRVTGISRVTSASILFPSTHLRMLVRGRHSTLPASSRKRAFSDIILLRTYSFVQKHSVSCSVRQKHFAHLGTPEWGVPPLANIPSCSA